MPKYVLLLLCGLLTACNYMYYRNNSIDKNDVIYVDRGGYQLQHFIKQHLEDRGYNVTVGLKKSSINTTYIESNESNSILAASDIGRARYVVQISEKAPKFMPMWCFFNGFWWWNFNASIADNQTGQEILGWTGRGCANSTMRKLDKALDKMEK